MWLLLSAPSAPQGLGIWGPGPASGSGWRREGALGWQLHGQGQAKGPRSCHASPWGVSCSLWIYSGRATALSLGQKQMGTGGRAHLEQPCCEVAGLWHWQPGLGTPRHLSPRGMGCVKPHREQLEALLSPAPRRNGSRLVPAGCRRQGAEGTWERGPGREPGAGA